MSGDLMPALTSSVLVHSSNLDSTRKLLAPSLRRPASGIFSLHARGESRLIKERNQVFGKQTRTVQTFRNSWMTPAMWWTLRQTANICSACYLPETRLASTRFLSLTRSALPCYRSEERRVGKECTCARQR